MYFYNPIGVIVAFFFALVGLMFVITGVVTFNVIGIVVGPVWCYGGYRLLCDSINQ
nr:MAG TPA: hypothetical protein [Caudoviricetes sp.]